MLNCHQICGLVVENSLALNTPKAAVRKWAIGNNHHEMAYEYFPPAKSVLCEVWAQRLQSESIRTRTLQMCRKLSLVSKLWNDAFSLKHTTYTKGPWAVVVNEMAVVASATGSAGGCCCRGLCSNQCPSRRWKEEMEDWEEMEEGIFEFMFEWTV